MARPVGIASHFLQAFDPVILEAVRKGRADSGMILVTAYSFYLDGDTVKEESFVLVEPDRPYPERRHHTVENLLPRQDQGDQGIELGRLE